MYDKEYLEKIIYVPLSGIKININKKKKKKNGWHFFISTFDNFQLCFFVRKDSITLKVLKMQFVFGWYYENLVKMNNTSWLWLIFLCLNQRQVAILGPLEWTKKQSWKSSKVYIKKWHSFLVFVCLNERHFLNHKISRNLAVKNWNFALVKAS